MQPCEEKDSEGEKEREREKIWGKKLGYFVVFSTLKNTRLSANLHLIFTRFGYLIGGGSGAEASGTNRRVLSLITYFGEIYQTLCLRLLLITTKLVRLDC